MFAINFQGIFLNNYGSSIAKWDLKILVSLGFHLLNLIQRISNLFEAPNIGSCHCESGAREISKSLKVVVFRDVWSHFRDNFLWQVTYVVDEK